MLDRFSREIAMSSVGRSVMDGGISVPLPNLYGVWAGDKIKVKVGRAETEIRTAFKVMRMLI